MFRFRYTLPTSVQTGLMLKGSRGRNPGHLMRLDWLLAVCSRLSGQGAIKPIVLQSLTANLQKTAYSSEVIRKLSSWDTHFIAAGS